MQVIKASDNCELKTRVVKGVVWRLCERFGSQGIGFLVTLVLARLLGPEAYGTIALLTIFISLAGVFVDSGFGTALIRKKDATEADFNSVFYFGLAVSFVLYALLFFSAPLVSAFYSRPVLTPLLRLLALILVVNSVNCVQNAVLAREMRFDVSFWTGLAQSLSTGIVGISMAYAGCGVWALAVGTFVGGGVGMFVRWFAIGWRPKFIFSTRAIRSLFSFSWKLLCSSLLDSFFVNLYGLVIGRVYSPSELAFYNRGFQFPRTAMDTINGSLMTVVFPMFSQLQDDVERLRRAMRKALQTSTFVVFPLMALLAAMAEPLIRLLLGDAWLSAVPFLRIGCGIFAFWPVHTVNLQILNALGRSDVFLRLEIMKKGLSALVLWLAYRHGVVVLALAELVVTTPLAILINAYPNARLVGYGILRQTKDVFPSLLAAFVLFVVTIPFAHFGWSCRMGSAHPFLLILGQMAVAGIVLVAYVWLVRPHAVELLAGFSPKPLRRLFPREKRR